MSDLDLAALRAVADVATPGPWEHNHEGLQGGEVIRAAAGRVARVYANTWPQHLPDCENAAFIAAFDPPTVLALLDRLEAAEARLASRYRLNEALGLGGEDE